MGMCEWMFQLFGEIIVCGAKWDLVPGIGLKGKKDWLQSKENEKAITDIFLNGPKDKTFCVHLKDGRLLGVPSGYMVIMLGAEPSCGVRWNTFNPRSIEQVTAAKNSMNLYLDCYGDKVRNLPDHKAIIEYYNGI